MAKLLKPQVDARPDQPALIDEFGATTWASFNERVNRLVHLLRASGLAPGDIFSVYSGNRREYFEAYAAAAHGGWLIVPINWHLVAEEVAYILGDSGSRAFIADARYAEIATSALRQADATKLNLALMVGGAPTDGFTSYEEGLASASPEEPADQLFGSPMFYTSGTTGKPKGVRGALSRAGAPVETLQFMGSALTSMMGLPQNGVTLLEGPVYHSAQWAFSFMPLVIGSSVVMRQKFDAEEMLDLIDQYKVTNMHLVPTQFVRLLKVDEERRARFDGSSIVIVWHGAAPCPVDVKHRMIEWWGPKISEYYGSTEGSFVTFVNSEQWLAKPGTLGKANASMEIRIVNDEGRTLGPNQPGQIYVKNLMGSDFEYHNDPEKTRKAHIEPGVFTFGDVGYLDEDGYLFMSDRKIDMIISGGVNIYPAEIEGVLVNHPAVLDAAVFGIPNEDFGEEVKAAIQVVEGVQPGPALAEELTAFCREHLAGYKVPRSFDFAASLPRNPAGKLMKRVLRDEYWKATGRTI